MFFALVACWWGMPCVVYTLFDCPSDARWHRVSREEYEELLSEGAIVSVSWAVAD